MLTKNASTCKEEGCTNMRCNGSQWCIIHIKPLGGEKVDILGDLDICGMPNCGRFKDDNKPYCSNHQVLGDSSSVGTTIVDSKWLAHTMEALAEKDRTIAMQNDVIVELGKDDAVNELERKLEEALAGCQENYDKLVGTRNEVHRLSKKLAKLTLKIAKLFSSTHG